MLGSKIWRANQLGQVGWSCIGNIDSFFLDEANLMSIFSLLARDAAGAPEKSKTHPYSNLVLYINSCQAHLGT